MDPNKVACGRSTVDEMNRELEQLKKDVAEIKGAQGAKPLNKMNKEELRLVAQEKGIDAEDLTKAEMIEAIEAE